MVTFSVIELLELELANIVVDGFSTLDPRVLCRGVAVFLGVLGQFFGELLGDVLPFFTVSPPTRGGFVLYLCRLFGELCRLCTLTSDCALLRPGAPCELL